MGFGGWFITGDARSLPLALASGTLPDVDHGADYLWYALCKEHRLLLPLHGYEWTLILFIWTFRRWGWGLATVITSSYLLHLLADQFENQTRPLGYFILFRLRKRFRLADISRDPVAGANGRMHDIEKLKHIARFLGLLN